MDVGAILRLFLNLMKIDFIFFGHIFEHFFWKIVISVKLFYYKFNFIEIWPFHIFPVPPV